MRKPVECNTNIEARYLADRAFPDDAIVRFWSVIRNRSEVFSVRRDVDGEYSWCRLTIYDDPNTLRIGLRRHGSSHLQRLVAEDIEHDTQYGDERLTFEHPGWHWDCYDDYEAASSATSEAFEILDEARQSIAAAKLVELTRWRKADDDEFEDADDDGEIRQWCYAAKASFMGKAIIFNRHTEWKDAE